MNVESQRLAQYQVKLANYKNQNTALEELRSKISALKSATASLSDIDNMQIYSAASSDKDVLTVSASSDANTGSHTVAINQLATAETWIQETSGFNYKTDYVGGGDFIYTYNNQQRFINCTENETTLQDLVNLINKDKSNPGVTASLLYQGGKYHLMLNGQETGQDYQISIDASAREVWKSDNALTDSQANAALSTRLMDLDQFTGSPGASDKITISGINHDGAALPDTELAITQNTTIGHLIDAINKHFDGTATARLDNGKIVLTDTSCDASALEISLSYSGDAAFDLPTMAVSTEGGSKVESLASISSDSFLETQNASNAKVKIDGFPNTTTNEVQALSFVGGTPTTGTFKLTLNGQTTAAIAYNAAAADIQSALSALSGIEPGDIVVEGTDMLTGDITVRFEGNLAGIDVTKMTVSENSTLDAGVVSVTETAKGNDGWIHRNSNNITDALSGITLNLQDVTETDSPVKVTVSRNVTTISKSIQTMVAAYNDLISTLKTDTEYDSDTKAMGILSTDVAATFLKTQAKSPFTSVAKGFIESMDDFIQADDLGLSLEGDGTLSFDTDTFNSAINENYKAVLEMLGAAKSGESSSTAVEVYSTSEKYTTAGIYNVKIEVNAANEIVSAKIKLADETEYRDAASWDGNIIYFDNSFNDGKPVNPENSLQLKVDLTEGTYGTDENPVVVRIKQGIFGTLEDTLNNMLKTNGQVDLSSNALDTKMTQMNAKIDREQTRLDKVEERLTQKYARLEKTLTNMQSQMTAVSSMLGTTG